MPTDVWIFDELRHAGEEHLDPAYVAEYDRKAAVDPADDLALLRSQGLSAQSTVVDLGAGTGTFALAASRPEAGWTRDELQTHLRQEYSTFTCLLESMLTHAGFAIQEAEYSASGIYAAYLCTRDAAS